MRTSWLTTSVLALSTLAFSAGCGAPEATPKMVGHAGPPAPATAAAPAPAVKNVSLADVGLDATALDRSVQPCDDFFRFACGGWISRTEIPPDKARWVRSFSVIQEQNEQMLNLIMKDAAAKPGNDPVMQQLGAYYGACTDESTVEAAGVSGIQPLMAVIDKGKNPAALVTAIVELHKVGVPAPWRITALQDFKNATQVIAFVDQAGLGLPERDYYLKDDEASKTRRDAYQAHVARMFELSGKKAAAAKKAAADVLMLETELAKVSKSPVEKRDVIALYNKFDRPGLAKLASNVTWDAYFQGLGLADVADVNITAPKFMEGIHALLKSVKPAVWQNYLLWHLLHAYGDTLPKKFVDENFVLEKLLTGAPEPPPRWKRCVQETHTSLREHVGRAFVARAFGPEAKQAAESMILAVKDAFAKNLATLSWMDAKTRERALAKLGTMLFKIGYPAKWQEYNFPIDRKTYTANALAAAAFEVKRQLTKIGKPVDREEWRMSPATVNAYYNPLLNEMVFPAAILQPPFFSPKAGVAVNLGAFGMVAGHELTHGYDDQGSKFAHDGNMTNWWEPSVAAQFKTKGQCVVDQYSRYEPLPGQKVKGELTLGENIADLGGLKLSFAAYRAMRKDAAERIVAEGFTEDQQFFLGTAQAWCAKARDEEIKRRLAVDSHSPAQFRIKGPLSNLDTFAEAFQCTEGTPMNPKSSCEVW